MFFVDAVSYLRNKYSNFKEIVFVIESENQIFIGFRLKILALYIYFCLLSHRYLKYRSEKIWIAKFYLIELRVLKRILLCFVKKWKESQKCHGSTQNKQGFKNDNDRNHLSQAHLFEYDFEKRFEIFIEKKKSLTFYFLTIETVLAKFKEISLLQLSGFPWGKTLCKHISCLPSKFFFQKNMSLKYGPFYLEHLREEKKIMGLL